MKDVGSGVGDPGTVMAFSSSRETSPGPTPVIEASKPVDEKLSAEIIVTVPKSKGVPAATDREGPAQTRVTFRIAGESGGFKKDGV
jgi:hypothetical protein